LGIAGANLTQSFLLTKVFLTFLQAYKTGFLKSIHPCIQKEIQTVLSNRDRHAALKNNRREITFQGTYLQIDKKEMLKTHSQVKTKELFALNY